MGESGLDRFLDANTAEANDFTEIDARGRFGGGFGFDDFSSDTRFNSINFPNVFDDPNNGMLGNRGVSVFGTRGIPINTSRPDKFFGSQAGFNDFGSTTFSGSQLGFSDLSSRSIANPPASISSAGSLVRF